MQLSIIIVNYNVKYFIEYCLSSVIAACKNIDAEVIVVDNCSKDDSVNFIQDTFVGKSPTPVHLIANTANLGFSKANNQALELAKGAYVLYLNPDTIVAEDCFETCLSYLQQNPYCGCLGPKLIDGKGRYLPESKRGFPSTKAAFYKMSGLSTLFKNSSIFNQYHLGNLSEDQTNEVDVLVGCFMMAPKAVLEKVGAFDEDYFMYGEDIDLSYKIQKAGYKNVYFPETTVTHFKGESTKKESLNYVLVFYNAMKIFASKHLSSSNKSLLIVLLNIAIGARALISIVNRYLQKLLLPLVDFTLIIIALNYTKLFWASKVKQEVNFYQHDIVKTFFVAYGIIWVISMFFNGAYDVPLKKYRIVRGMLAGALITLAAYGLLPETVRFSRGITLLGAISSTLLIVSIRYLFQALNVGSVRQFDADSKNILIVGEQADYEKIKDLLFNAAIDKDIVGYVSVQQTDSKALGTLHDLETIAATYKVAEIIFTQHILSYKQIIAYTTSLPDKYNFKFYTPGASSIIGSNSKNTAGDLYASDWHFKISEAAGKRNKRVFDILMSMGMLVFSPLLLLLIKNKTNYFINCLKVLGGNYTWVVYHPKADSSFLPKLKKGIFNVVVPPSLTETAVQRINILYARNYTIKEDWENLLKNLA